MPNQHRPSRVTEHYQIPVLGDDASADWVGGWGSTADAVDAAVWAAIGNLAAATSGPLAERPAATETKVNALYVATDTVNVGRAFLTVGAEPASRSWVELARNLRLARILAEAAADVPARITLAANPTGDALQVQTPGGVNLFRLTARGRPVPPVDPVTELTYDATTGTLTGVIVRTVAGGGTVLSSATLTYNPDGSLATVVETADGRTVTTTITYTAGRLTSSAKVAA